MVYFYILIALFIADGITTHLLMRTGNAKETGLIAKLVMGRVADPRELIAFTVVKVVAFGYLFMLTEGAERLHQGLLIGAGAIVLWNIGQLVRAYRGK